MPPRPRLLHRQRLQQSSKLIGIGLQQPAGRLRDSPRHIRRPLPYLRILSKQLPHQCSNRDLIPTNLLRDRPRQRQPPLRPSQSPPQRLHAAKYSQPHRTNKKAPENRSPLQHSIIHDPRSRLTRPKRSLNEHYEPACPASAARRQTPTPAPVPHPHEQTATLDNIQPHPHAVKARYSS